MTLQPCSALCVPPALLVLPGFVHPAPIPMAPLVPPHQELLLHANPDLLVLLETVLFVVMDSTQREAHVLNACRSELPHVTRSLGWMLSHAFLAGA